MSTKINSSIWLTGEIDQTLVQSIQKEATEIKGKINELWIHTNGGSQYLTRDLIGFLIKNNGYPKKTIGHNYVYSCGVYLLQIGQERLCKEKTEILIHRHNYNGVVNLELSESEKVLYRYLANKSKQDFNKIVEIASLNNGYGVILKPYQAKELGLVDRII